MYLVRTAVFPILISLFLSTISGDGHSTRFPTRLTYQYPSVGTWIENIAVRSNGDLLLTSLNNPGGLSLLNPVKGSHPRRIVTSADLGYLNSTLGIVQVEEDVFYILAANYSLAKETLGTQAGTNALFRIDIRSCDQAPEVQLMMKFGEDVLSVNGLTKFNDSLLLAADSIVGAVWAIDTEAGKYFELIQDDLMAPPNPQGTQYKEGINGLHFLPDPSKRHGNGGALYFTNSQRYLFGKVILNGSAKVVGSAEWIADSITEDGVKVNWDDFALGEHAKAWIATEAGNSVQSVTSQGKVEVVAGNVNSTELAEPTSAAFGRTKWDRDILYVATAGGLGFPVWNNGKAERVGAQIVAVNTSQCGGRGRRSKSAGGWQER